MDSNDMRYMRLALEQGELALANGWIPVGALFVKDNRVVTHGRKTGLLHPLFDHAEHNGCYQALWSRDGPKNLDGFDVYATLEPCVMCMSMLMTTRVRRIVYGFPDCYGGGGFMLSHPEHLPERFAEKRPTLVSGVLARESQLLLRRFFDAQRGSEHWSDQDNGLIKSVYAEV